jgi:hypothetical protein
MKNIIEIIYVVVSLPIFIFAIVFWTEVLKEKFREKTRTKNIG